LKNEPLIHIKQGESINVSALVKDPDDDAYDVRWWQFQTLKSDPILGISSTDSLSTLIKIPVDAKNGQIFTLVFEVKDKGKINLTSYKTVKIVID